MKTFEQHPAVERPRCLDGLLHLLDAVQVHRHAISLLAIHRLDHHPAVLLDKRQVVIGIARQLLGRHVQAGLAEHLVGQALVLAQAHADGAGQVAEGLAATNPSPAVAKGEQTGGRVVNLHVDATFIGFFNEDAGIGVKPDLGARPQKQRLVDAVLALDGKGRQGAKAQFGVEVLGLGIVMQHRQVEIAQAAAHKVLDQMPYQHFTHSRA